MEVVKDKKNMIITIKGPKKSEAKKLNSIKTTTVVKENFVV